MCGQIKIHSYTVYLDNFELENNKAYDAKQQSISLHTNEAYTAENKGQTSNEVEEYDTSF